MPKMGPEWLGAKALTECGVCGECVGVVTFAPRHSLSELTTGTTRGVCVRNTACGILGVLALVLATACGDPVAPTTLELLQGDWTWIESSGGITGGNRTPESTGETMSIRFVGPDSVEVTRDGVLTGATTYRLVLTDDGGSTSIEYAESVLGFARQGLSVKNDVLILSDGCCDGYAYRFERAS